MSTDPDPVRAVLYAAKRTKDTGGSIPDQLRQARAAAEAEGQTVIAEFQDEGFSAYSRNRGPGLARARDLAEREGADLWCLHSDRLARGAGAKRDDPMHLVECVMWANRADVRLRSVEDDEALRSLAAAANQGERNTEDSRRKSLSTKAGLRRRVERGLEHGGTPAYGHQRVDRIDDVTRQVARTEKGKPIRDLVPDPAEAAVVQRIYADFIGGVPQQTIARRLAAEGVRKKRGGTRWTQPHIHVILANPTYVGKLRVHGEVVPGAHEPIIDAGRWEEVQALLKTVSGDRGRPAEGFLLGGRLLRCTCGATMFSRSSRDCYLCSERHHDPRSCGMPTLPRRLVDEAILRYFTDQLLDREESRRRAIAAADEQATMVREGRLQAERDLIRARERLDRVRRDYQDGHLPVGDWNEQREQLEGEYAAAEAEAERLRDRERLLAETPDLPDVLEDLHERLLAPVRGVETTASLRAALRRVFSHFEVSERPPTVLPTSVAADGLSGPEPPPRADEAAAMADRVREGLGVTIRDDGPFWDEARFYLNPVLLPGVDLGLEAEPWAVVEGVAIDGQKPRSARAQV